MTQNTKDDIIKEVSQIIQNLEMGCKNLTKIGVTEDVSINAGNLVIFAIGGGELQ